MAYDLNRCPQTENEFAQYFYTLIGCTPGSNANDFEAVLSKKYPWQGQSLMIPPGVGPGITQPSDAPFFGLTQQYSGAPKGRVFLPSNQADENGYYTSCWQYLDDAAGTYSTKRDPKQQFSAKSGGLVWAWYHVAGHAYSPVTGANGGSSSSDELSEAQLQQVEALVRSIAVMWEDKIALQASGGKVMCAESGGPAKDNDPFDLTARSGIGPWESFTIHKGV